MTKNIFEKAVLLQDQRLEDARTEYEEAQAHHNCLMLAFILQENGIPEDAIIDLSVSEEGYYSVCQVLQSKSNENAEVTSAGDYLFDIERADDDGNTVTHWDAFRDEDGNIVASRVYDYARKHLDN